MLLTPERNAVVNLTAENGVRISGRFHHSMAGHWSIDLTERDLLSINAGSLVELQVMANAQLHVCQAQIAAVNHVSHALVLANIEQHFSRALRASERVPAAFACAMIVGGHKPGSSYQFSDRSHNALLNVSEGGALIACRQPLSHEQPLILLAASGEGLLPGRLSLPATVVREAAAGEVQADTGGRAQFYYYGVQFGALPPRYRALLSQYIHQRQQAVGYPNLAACS